MLVTAKWSIDDYHKIIASGVLEGRNVELINREIVEMPPEGEPHAYSSDEAGEYLTYLLGDRAKVRPAKPITLPDSNSEPEPDISVVQRLGRTYRQHHPYPENIFWLIEYSDSSLSQDLEVKNRLYAAAGIPEYWVVISNPVEYPEIKANSRSPLIKGGWGGSPILGSITGSDINLKKMELIVMRSPSSDGYQSATILTDGAIAPLAFADIEIEVVRLLNP